MNIAKYQHLLDAKSNERKRFINLLFDRTNVQEGHKVTPFFCTCLFGQLMNCFSCDLQVEKQIRKLNYQKKVREGKLEDSKEDHIRYGLGHNSLFYRFHSQAMLKWNCRKMASAICTKEPEIIYDCCFHHTMTPVELRSSAKHLKCSLMANMRSAQPFVVHICNVTKDSPLEQMLQQEIPYLHKLPVFIHEHDITEIMSPERLVYLSPNSQHVIDEYNPHDCYVMGCIVERGEKLALTLPKAIEYNIRTARLPLDKIFPCSKHKVLSLEQVTGILITARQSNNWQQAITQHLPESDDEYMAGEHSEII